MLPRALTRDTANPNLLLLQQVVLADDAHKVMRRHCSMSYTSLVSEMLGTECPAALLCFHSPSALPVVDTKADLLSLTFKVWGALKCTGSAAVSQTPQHCRCSPPRTAYNGESMPRKPLVLNKVSEVWGMFLNME